MSFAGGEVIKMKIEKNETYDISKISRDELEWLNIIISDAIDCKKFNHTVVDPIEMRDQIESILYGDKK